MLPAPSGTVTVVILGGASNVAIRRPKGPRAAPRGWWRTNLTFDDRHIGAAGGELDLRSGATTAPRTATTSPLRAAQTT